MLSFSHLAVGGANLPATNSMHLLASIRILQDGGVAIDIGEGDGDVTVDAEGNSTVQVRSSWSSKVAFQICFTLAMTCLWSLGALITVSPMLMATMRL